VGNHGDLETRQFGALSIKQADIPYAYAGGRVILRRSPIPILVSGVVSTQGLKSPQTTYP
jgi:hypothetical protein